MKSVQFSKADSSTGNNLIIAIYICTQGPICSWATEAVNIIVGSHIGDGIMIAWFLALLVFVVRSSFE